MPKKSHILISVFFICLLITNDIWAGTATGLCEKKSLPDIDDCGGAQNEMFPGRNLLSTGLEVYVAKEKVERLEYIPLNACQHADRKRSQNQNLRAIESLAQMNLARELGGSVVVEDKLSGSLKEILKIDPCNIIFSKKLVCSYQDPTYCKLRLMFLGVHEK